MARDLDDKSQDILSFRPDIRFVEPDIERQFVNPSSPDLQLEDVEQSVEEVRNLAQTVNSLATLVQARADQRAKNMKIKLDPNADFDTIQAMQRKFPNANPLEITYDQYRQVKDEIRAEGLRIGAQGRITPEQLNPDFTQVGGFDTEEARVGLFRPETVQDGQIIEPLNLPDIQIALICILANFIWKNFMKGVFDKAGIPYPVKVTIGSLLPDEICDPGEGLDIPGLFILGQSDIPGVFTGKATEEATDELGRTTEELSDQ